jgi:hypothetical protein
VFITQTGPKKSKEVQSKIRKHVMKDIGRARRKEGRKGAPLRFALEIPDSLEDISAPSGVEVLYLDHQPNPLRILEGSVPLVNRNKWTLSKTDASQYEVQPYTQSPTADNFPFIDRLWTGRMDPFIRYPVEMDRRLLQLMDHGRLKLSVTVNLSIIDVLCQSLMTDMGIHLPTEMLGYLLR